MEIELYSRLANPIEAIDRIGEFFAKSGMFGCDRPEQGKVLAMVCLAERKSPVAITRTYDIVEGKLRKKALAALAEFRGLGGKHRWLRSGDEPAEKESEQRAELELVSPDSNLIVYAYSMADARAEGLVRDKSRWVKRPGNMLRARCISNGLGMLMPEIYAGDDESEPTAGPALDLVGTEKAATVTEVTTPQSHGKSDDERAEAEMGLAPVIAAKAQESKTETEAQPTTPAPAFAAGPKLTEQPKGGLSDELARQVETAIGAEHSKTATAWMLKEGWLKAGQDLVDLTPARAKRIINQRESFIRAITGSKA